MKRKDVLLVIPKFEDFNGDILPAMPILAAIARQEGYDVEICDLNIQGLPTKQDYAIVGITGMSVWKNEIIAIAQHYPSSCVIVGGAWATISPEEVLSNPEVKYVCVGEGEEVWQNFLIQFPNVENVKGLAYLKNGKFTFTMNNNLITDFSRYPLPAWDLMNISKYKRVGIITSRGCPYRCVFCTTWRFVTRVWRGRKPEHVLTEIDLLVKLGVKSIVIAEDSPTQDMKRFETLLLGIIERKYQVNFLLGNARADRLNRHLLELMKTAGFTHVCISPEHGVQRVLDEVIHKNLNLSVVEPLIKDCVSLGMTIQTYFVIGFPHETKTEIEQTITYMKHLRDLGASTTVQNIRPIIGTELYEQSKKEGSLLFDGQELDDILTHRNKFESIHTLKAMVKPYWTPDYVIWQRNEEVKRGRREALKKRAFSLYALKLLLKQPRYVLKVLRQSL